MASLPQRSLSQKPPAGVEWVWMDPSGTLVSGEGCDGARRYPMLTASIPEEADRCGSRDGDKKKGVLQWFKGWFD